MLKNTTIESLKALGFDVDKLIAAVKAETETDFELPKINAFTDEELGKRDKSFQKDGYDKGKAAGQEMLLDDMRKAEGLEYEGQSKENFLAAIKTKVQGETGKDVDTKVKDRDKQIQGLKENLSKYEKDLQSVKGEYDSFKQSYEFISLLPENRNKILTNEEWVSRLKNNGVTLEQTESGLKALKVKGEFITNDKTKDPLDAKEALTKLFTSNEGWVTTEQQNQVRTPGKGLGDNRSPVGVYKNLREFKDAQEAQGINVKSQAFQQNLQKAVADYPEMDMSL